jgi:hypothetical protein
MMGLLRRGLGGRVIGESLLVEVGGVQMSHAGSPSAFGREAELKVVLEVLDLGGPEVSGLTLEEEFVHDIEVGGLFAQVILEFRQERVFRQIRLLQDQLDVVQNGPQVESVELAQGLDDGLVVKRSIHPLLF